MRRLVIAIVLLVSPAALASTWEIDPAHTSVQFAVRHLMVSTVRGNLGKVSGIVNLDENDITQSTVAATIDAAGIDTREPKRDAHLKGPDFLDVATYPTITFKSKRVSTVVDGRFKVTGDVSIHGVTKEVVLDVEGSATPVNDPFGNVRLGGIARAKINRQDFGVSWSKVLEGGGLTVGNDLDVTIDVELTKKSAAGDAGAR